MKEKSTKYELKVSVDKFNEIIHSEINKSPFQKRYNLSGEFSSEGGIDIYNSFRLITFSPSMGPITKLNLICSNSSVDGTLSVLKLKRVNGVTFYLQYWFSIVFIIVTSIITLNLYLGNRFNSIEIFLLPIFGIIYLLIISLIADSSTKNLVSIIENILKKESIKYKKL